MRRLLRTCVLAIVIAATPACAALAPRLENPVAGAQTPDQRAYALLNTYAAVLEEAADIARDPAVPIEMKRALARAESAATPAVDALHAALGVYLTARDDRAAARLRQASEAAETPMATLLELVRAEQGGAP